MKSENSRIRSGRTRIPAFLSALLSTLLAFTGLAGAKASEKGSAKFVSSKDGTRIAYDKAGKGPALILVGGALSDRAGAAGLAKLLAGHFTVYSFDRRGRGESGDTAPYAVKREIEDIAALIRAAGGSAYVYGKSSGACLALEAASSLGDQIPKLALYEAPYSEAEGAAKEWKAFDKKLNGLLEKGRDEEAVEMFFEFVGAPKAAVAGMKITPAWAGMVKMAPTLAYDNAVVGADRSVPVERASKIQSKTLVMDGGASLEAMPFMKPSADKIARAIPKAERRTLEGQGHDVDPKVVTAALVKFFQK